MAPSSSSKYYEELGRATLQQFKEYTNSQDGWKTATSTSDGVLVEFRPSDVNLGGKILRTVYTMPTTPDIAYELSRIDPDSPRAEWQPHLTSIEMVEKITDELKITCVNSSSMLFGLVSARDILQLIMVTREDDVIYNAAVSVERDDYPHKKGFVREESFPEGFQMEQVSSDPSKTKVTVISHIKNKGKLPQSIVDSALPKVMVASYRHLMAYMKSKGYATE